MVLTPVSGHILVTPVTESIDFVALQQRLRWAELRILQLEEQLRLARIAKYGPSSEKLNDAQLLLLEQEPGVSRCLQTSRPPEPARLAAARRANDRGQAGRLQMQDLRGRNEANRLRRKRTA